MRSASLPLLVLLAAAGCTAPPPPPPPPPAQSRFQVDRSVIRALGEHVRAIYDARLAQEHPGAAPGALDAEALEARLAATRDDLRRAMREAGASPAEVASDEALLPTIRDEVAREGRYAFLLSASQDAFSLPLVRIRERELPRSVVLFGEPFAYRLTVFDETLIPDYPSYAAQRLGRPGPLGEVGTYRGDGLITIDRAAARAIGERQFLPQLELLKASGQAIRDDQAFLRRAEAEQLGELLLLAKQGLRWRSLEQLWSLVQGRPVEEQLTRFAEDYAARAELRAAAELRELVRRVPAAQQEGALDAEQQQLLYELGTLSAIVHGEPLGQLADVFALTALSLVGPRHEPPFRGARQLVLDFVAAARDGPPSEAADALAFARLCRAAPDELRALAAELYRRRTG